MAQVQISYKGTVKMVMYVAYLPQGRSPNRKPAQIVMQEMIARLDPDNEWVYPPEKYPYVGYRIEDTRRRFCKTREEAEEWLFDKLQERIEIMRAQFERVKEDLVSYETRIYLEKKAQSDAGFAEMCKECAK